MIKPDTAISSSDRAPKLLAQVVDAIRIRHYSIRTEEAYVYWVKACCRSDLVMSAFDNVERSAWKRCGGFDRADRDERERGEAAGSAAPGVGWRGGPRHGGAGFEFDGPSSAAAAAAL